MFTAALGLALIAVVTPCVVPSATAADFSGGNSTPTPTPTGEPNSEPSATTPPSNEPAKPNNPAPGKPEESKPAEPKPEEKPKDKTPTWDEVNKAAESGNTAAAQELIASIESQIAGLESSVTSAIAATETAGAEYEKARTAAEERRGEVAALDEQIKDAEEQAEASAASLGTMAVHLRNHTAGFEPEVITFFNSDPGEDFLYQLTTVNRFSDNESAMLAQAEEDQVTLAALRKDAEVKLAEAEELEKEAETQRDAAVAAQVQAQAQQAAAVEAKKQLEAMLGVLGGEAPSQDDLNNVLAAQQAAYEQGMAALANAGIDVGSLTASSSGAYAPLFDATMTDGYGMRVHPVLKTIGMHWGSDYVVSNGGTCGAPLYAIKGGTVEYAGPMGGLGNVVQIKLEDGTKILYGHILDGGLGVATGQTVTAGQPVALAGSTGYSTGCHLHLEVEQNGQHVDPHSWLIGLGVAS